MRSISASSSTSAPPPPSSAGTPASTSPAAFSEAKLSATNWSSSVVESARSANTGPSSRAISATLRDFAASILRAAFVLIMLFLRNEISRRAGYRWSKPSPAPKSPPVQYLYWRVRDADPPAPPFPPPQAGEGFGWESLGFFAALWRRDDRSGILS